MSLAAMSVKLGVRSHAVRLCYSDRWLSTAIITIHQLYRTPSYGYQKE